MYKFLLANRYLRTRFIALASIVSVTLGVATMIVVNSVMSGFSSQMRDRIHAILADVMIETTSTDGTDDPRGLMEDVQRLAGNYIDSMTPSVEIYGMLGFDWAGQVVYRPCTIIGIDPQGKNRVSPFAGYMLSRQDVLSDDELVRGPLRPLHEPLDWELTDEAQQTRRDWIEWEQFKDQYDRQYGEIPAPAPTPATGSVSLALAQEAPGVVEWSDPFASDQPSSAGPAQQIGAEFPAMDDFVDPFASSSGSRPQGDPAAPRFGRIYIGAGLVSFPFKDKATGKTHIMYMVKPGQDVNLTTIKTGKPEPANFKATVVDIFKSGMSEYDSNLIYCNLEQLQLVRGMLFPPDPTKPFENLDWKNGAITSLQIKLKNYNDAGEVVRRLRSGLPGGVFQVRTWEEKQGPLLEAVAMESAILNVLLFLIITVAGFGILAIFYMIVVEKTRDIGILKALGASSRGVMVIFLSYGLSLGIVGSGVGVVLGLLFVRYINQIEKFLSFMTGRKVFDEAIYYFREIPTVVHPGMVFSVAMGAIIIAVLASVLPARRASRMHPVQALRYE